MNQSANASQQTAVDHWQQLVQQGVLGTERQPTVPALPPALAALMDGTAAAATPSPESTFLQHAIFLTQYRAAGWQPLAHQPPSSVTAVEPVATSSTPNSADRRTALYHQLHNEADNKLLIEWLHHAARQQVSPPRDQLPSLLDRAMQDRAVATALLPCLDERGHWLVGLNPAWQFTDATALDEASWQSGSTEARGQFLTALRATDAECARTLLQEGWSTETAADRAALLTALQVNQSTADQSFLEKALQDRSRQVRTVAARLLAGQSTTALYATLLALLKRHITIERKWLKRQLVIQLPDHFDEQWHSWGIREQSPLAVRVGAKAGWLVQLLALVPPSAFVDALGIEAVDLLALIQASDYTEALMTALLEGAEAHSDYEFLLTELRHLLRLVRLSQIPQQEFVDRYARYAPILPDAQRQELLHQYLTTMGKHALPNWTMLQQLSRNVSALSSAITNELLTKQLPALFGRKTGDYGVGRILIDLAYQLDPQGYPQAETLLQRRQGEEVPDYIDRFRQLYHLRHRMAQIFAD